MRVRSVLAVLTIVLVALPAVSNPLPPPGEYVYKTIGERDLKLHVSYPPGWKAADRRPVIVFFFGGAWSFGSVKAFAPQADHLAKRGLVAIRADYRVKTRDGVTPDRCVEDARSAVRWVRKNAAKLGVDPEKLITSGGSAGGHLAACAAIGKCVEAEGDDLSISTVPVAMVLFNPVLDFTVDQLARRLGGDADLAKKISPTLHLHAKTPPSLLLYGSRDGLLVQGDAYVEKAKALGVRSECFVAVGQGHSFFNRRPWRDTTTREMDRFLESLGLLKPSESEKPDRKDRKRRRPMTTQKPDHADLKYGPHARNVLDLWTAKGEGPRPLVIYYHGGGFRAGDKRSVNRDMLAKLLGHGVSVAAVNYRFTDTAPFPAQMNDAARALQFLRHSAKKYGIDPKRVGATGGSAGAGISLWLAFHDDLADPESDDPVARQSTRLSAAVVTGGQSSYDPRFIRNLFETERMHPALFPFFGMQSGDDIDDPKFHALFAEASPITHATADDAPVLLYYSQPNEPLPPNSDGGKHIHHPKFGFVLKEKLDALGVECVLRLRKDVPHGAETREFAAFFLAKLGVKAR